MSRRGYIIVGLCVTVSAAGALGLRESFLHRRGPLPSTRAGAKVSLLARALRPNYPYSVIPGGVYSPAELRSAVRRDALVREHYANFNLNSLQLVKLTEDHYSFVSYRKDGRLFWTRKRLKIPRGEILITDGTNYAKTRCGNRISETPMSNSGITELPAQVLSPPPIQADQLAGLEFVPAPVASERDWHPGAIAPPAAVPATTSIPSLQPGTSSPGFASAPTSASLGNSGAGSYTDTSAPAGILAGPAGSGQFANSATSGHSSKVAALPPLPGWPATPGILSTIPSTGNGVAPTPVPEPSFRLMFVTLLSALVLLAGIRAAQRTAVRDGCEAPR